MEECKKRGLYYNYDENFTPDHCFETQKLFILDVNTPTKPPKDTFKDAVVDIEEELDQPIEIIPKISCNALYGFTSP